MKSDRIEIKVLEDAEIELTNEFFNSIYKAGRDKEKFIWEFRRPPAQTGVYVVAKDLDSNKIVGSQGAIPIEIITGDGETIMTAKSEDTLVHPDFRGLSIFENMYKRLFEECEKKGIKYIWGFTYAKKPFTKLGFDCPYVVSQTLMAFDVMASARYLTHYQRTKTLWSKSKAMALCVFSKGFSLKSTFSKSDALKGITYSTADRKAMEDNSTLIKDILSGSPEGFMIKQDLRYLKWRIADNPYHEEIVNVYFYSDTRLAAHIVFNHHEHGVWYLIQDLYSRTLSENQRTAVFKKAVTILRNQARNKVKLIRTWEFVHNELSRQNVAIRKRSGFIHLRHGALFVWKSLGGAESLSAVDFILSRIASEGKI